MEWAKNVNMKGLTVFEKHLGGTSGKYCVGDEVTLADVFLIPQLYNANRFGLDIASNWPKIAAIQENLNQLPEFVKAHADNQPDAQV